MLAANHSNIANFIFRRYLKHLFKKNFDSISIIGNLPDISNKPILLLPNHISWWDGFFVHYLNDIHFKRKMYLMVIEETLVKYKFFLKLGAFSIDKSKPKEVIKAFDYAAEILKNNNSLLGIYPQAELVPALAAEIKYRNGLELLFKKVNSEYDIVLMAVRIIHLKNKLPSVFISLSKVLNSKEKLNVSRLNELHNELLIKCDKSIFDNHFGN